MIGINKVKPAPGQESVWDYPRPPAVRACNKIVKIVLDGEVLAETNHALCVLETSHPPTYYLPPEDVTMKWLKSIDRTSFCEWKGVANYYDVVNDHRRLQQVAWTYRNPTDRYKQLKDYIVFYAHVMDACYVGDEIAKPQPGNFYGGWITSDVVGPFKGEPGTMGW